VQTDTNDEECELMIGTSMNAQNLSANEFLLIEKNDQIQKLQSECSKQRDQLIIFRYL
jgi:hypothetical protein